MRINIPNKIKNKATLKKFKELMSLDKKVKNNHINLILIKTLGNAYVANKYSKDKLDNVIKNYIN